MPSKSRKRLKLSRNSRKTSLLDGSDEIFRLPDDILQHLLFYLPFEDSASLSAVSKTWRRIYNSLPVFEFSFDLEEHGTLEDFVTLINKSLSILKNRRAIIENFCLNMDLSGGKGSMLKSHLDDWLSLIMKNYVKAIDLGVSNSSDNIHFTLPQSVFTFSKSLVKLHLKGCKFPTNISLTGGNDDDKNDDRKSRFNEFNCLKEISLVDVVARDDQIQELVNLARNFLENLIIASSSPMELLGLEFFSKLDSIEVNVKKVYLNQAKKLDKVGLYSLRRAYTFGVDNITSLTFAIGNNNCVFRSIQALVSSLQFLDTLELFMMRSQRMRIHNRNLKTLKLFEGQRFEEPLEVELDTSELMRIDFYGFCIPFITVYGENQALVCNHFGGHHSKGVDGSQLHMLGKFSQNLMQAMVTIRLHRIEINDENGQNVVKTLEELREEPVVHRPSSLKMLILDNCIPEASNYTSFLNALFWTCHPRTLVVLMTSEQTLKSPHRASFIGDLVNELVMKRKKNPTCCAEPNKPKCWRHYVAQVKFNVYNYSMLKEFYGEELPYLVPDHDDDDQTSEDDEMMSEMSEEDDDDEMVSEMSEDDDEMIFGDAVDATNEDEEEVEDEEEDEQLVVEFNIVWEPYPYHW